MKYFKSNDWNDDQVIISAWSVYCTVEGNRFKHEKHLVPRSPSTKTSKTPLPQIRRTAK